MATTSTQPKKRTHVSTEKSANEKSDRTLARKVVSLEERIEILEDLAELKMEEAYARFREAKPRRPIPDMIFGSPSPCHCAEMAYREEGGAGGQIMETLFWVTLGVVVLVVSRNRQNGGQ